ncbi:MAG: hypothetical protein FJ386_13765 [Verrucomicrobia bacterium]|nr:hypothetical protein [Verrucomicrobiota bacterium]
MDADSIPGPERWSCRRWVGVISLVFAAQAGLVWKLSAPLAGPAAVHVPAPTVRLVLGEEANRRLLDSLAAGDPTLFARVSPQGFSGAAWVNVPRQDYKLQDWTEPVRFMDRSTGHVGGAFQEFIRTNRPPLVAVADKPGVVPSVTPLPSSPAITQSAWRVEGPLRNRAVQHAVQPRSFDHPDLLAETRVRVFVNAEGHVFSPQLLATATANDPVQRAADQHALGLTRSMRFQPLPKSAARPEMTPGVVVFRWHTVPPPAKSGEVKP